MARAVGPAVGRAVAMLCHVPCARYAPRRLLTGRLSHGSDKAQRGAAAAAVAAVAAVAASRAGGS